MIWNEFSSWFSFRDEEVYKFYFGSLFSGEPKNKLRNNIRPVSVVIILS